jgi:anti-sigma factor (TIGR02949 family)
MQHSADTAFCEEVRSSLPWFLTGRLPEREAQELRSHLDGCSACRAELALEQRLRAAVGSEGTVELAPQGAMRKFFERLDSLEPDLPARAPAPSQSRWRSAARWRVAAAVVVVVQAIGLGALATRVAVQDARLAAAPVYVTQTAASVPVHGPRLRVVVDPSLSVANFERLLRGIDAEIVAGPSDAHVYTHALPATTAPRDVAERAESLRQNPAVRFAEPVDEGARP